MSTPNDSKPSTSPSSEVEELGKHTAMIDELLNHEIKMKDKSNETPDLSKLNTSQDLIPANILSEPRYAAFGAGPIENTQNTVTETMVKATKNTDTKVKTVSSLSVDKKEGSIEDGVNPTLKAANTNIHVPGVKALEEAKNNVEGGNGVAILSNTEVQVSSLNTFNINSGRVGSIQSALLVSQAASNIDYSEVKTVVNNLQNERSKYRYTESDRDIHLTNKTLQVSQSSEERTLRKSLEAVQSYDETSSLIARNSEKDTTITDNKESYVTQDDIHQAQKGGVHFMVGNSGLPSNTPALFRPILPGEYNPMEQVVWSMTGGSIQATSTEEFNIKTLTSNTTAKNIGLIAKSTLSSIASNNGIYGDMTTMIGKKALSTGTSLLSMTTMIGKFTFMGGFLSVLHQVLDGDISRIAQIILPRIKLPSNLPIPPLPPKASAYTETDLRQCLPNYQEEEGETSDKPLFEYEYDSDIIPTTPPFNPYGDKSIEHIPSSTSSTPTSSSNKQTIRDDLIRDKATNNQTFSSTSSGPPSSVAWKESQVSTEDITNTSTTSSTYSISSSSQVQKGIELIHKVAFTPNTYLEPYQLSPVKSSKYSEPPIDSANSTVKSGYQTLTRNYLSEELKVNTTLSTLDKRLLLERIANEEVFNTLQDGIIPSDLNDKQKEFLQSILDSLLTKVGIGVLSIPGLVKSVIPDSFSRFINNVTQVGDKLIDKISSLNTNDLILNLKQDTRDTLKSIGSSAFEALKNGDLTNLETNLTTLISNIFQTHIGVIPTYSTFPSIVAPDDGGILRDIILPPYVIKDISPLIVSYIMEPQDSIEDIERLIRSSLEKYFGSDVAKVEEVYKRIKPLVRKVKEGDILDLVSKENIRNTVSTIGGDNLVKKIDGAIDNIESIIGTVRSLEAIPSLLKLLNEEKIPTLSKVSTILSCLDLADRVSDLIGIIKNPLSYKPKSPIPQAITFFDAPTPPSMKDVQTEEGYISSIYTQYSITPNPYMDTLLAQRPSSCFSTPSISNIPLSETIALVPNSSSSSIDSPPPPSSSSLEEFIKKVKVNLVNKTVTITINQSSSSLKDYLDILDSYPDSFKILIYYQ